MGSVLTWLKEFLISIFSNVIRWVALLFEYLRSIIEYFLSLWQYILDFFADLFILIFNLLVDLWDRIVLIVFDFLQNSLSFVLSFFPDFSNYFSSLSEVRPFLYLATDWFALDVAVTLLGSYLAFIPVMIITKLVIKLFIPTVG